MPPASAPTTPAPAAAALARAELRERLESWCFDPPGARLSFAAKLARQNGWTARQAERVIAEYRRFLLLAATAGHPVCPSDAVDQAWHQHLLDTRADWEEFCPRVLGRPLLFFVVLLGVLTVLAAKRLSTRMGHTQNGRQVIQALNLEYQTQPLRTDNKDPWLLAAFALMGMGVLPGSLASAMAAAHLWATPNVAAGGDGGGTESGGGGAVAAEGVGAVGGEAAA